MLIRAGEVEATSGFEPLNRGFADLESPAQRCVLSVKRALQHTPADRASGVLLVDLWGGLVRPDAGAGVAVTVSIASSTTPRPRTSSASHAAWIGTETRGGNVRPAARCSVNVRSDP